MSRLLIRERARICKWLCAPTAFARRPGRLGLPPLSGWNVLLSRTAFTACRPALGQLDAAMGRMAMPCGLGARRGANGRRT